MKHEGGCHYGQIAFEVDGELKQVIDCNCSPEVLQPELNDYAPQTHLAINASLNRTRVISRAGQCVTGIATPI